MSERFNEAEAEGIIQNFLGAADAEAGAPVGELLDACAEVAERAYAEIEQLLTGCSYEKGVAVMLLLGRFGDQAPADSPLKAQLHAASSLLSGLLAQSLA